MRVLLINQFFWPDSAATSQLLTDLARGLKDRGHEVYVLCTDGGYAPKNETNDPQVHVIRVKSLPFARQKWARVLSYGSFLLACAIKGLVLPRPELVITLTTPPVLSLIGTLIKAIRGSDHFIWEMDLYPDVAVDLEYIKPGGSLDRMAGALVDFSRKRADGIVALGNCMRQRLISRGLSRDKIHVAHNWADGNLIRPVPRSPLNLSLSVLYSGNLGLAHDTDTLSQAMLSLRDDSRFHFVFAGGGSRRKAFEQYCQQMDIRSVEFRPYVQREKLSGSLGGCDVGLITQREACAGSLVPSKVYGLMAAGRPVLFIGPADSTVSEIIGKFRCGWQIDNGDVGRLVALLKFLANEPAHVQAAGKCGRKAFEQHYDLPIGVSRICELVGAAVEEPQSEAAHAGR